MHQQRDTGEPQLLHTPKVCVPLTTGRQRLVKVMQLLVQPGKGLWPQSVFPSPFSFAKSLPEARATPPPCLYTPPRWALEVKKDGDPKMYSHHSGSQ